MFLGRAHAKESTPGVSVIEKIRFHDIGANSGEMIYTTPNLQAFRRWFESEAERTLMNIYNTTWNGTNIKETPFINERVY